MNQLLSVNGFYNELLSEILGWTNDWIIILTVYPRVCRKWFYVCRPILPRIFLHSLPIAKIPQLKLDLRSHDGFNTQFCLTNDTFRTVCTLQHPRRKHRRKRRLSYSTCTALSFQGVTGKIHGQTIPMNLSISGCDLEFTGCRFQQDLKVTDSRVRFFHCRFVKHVVGSEVDLSFKDSFLSGLVVQNSNRYISKVRIEKCRVNYLDEGEVDSDYIDMQFGSETPRTSTYRHSPYVGSQGARGPIGLAGPERLPDPNGTSMDKRKARREKKWENLQRQRQTRSRINRR